MCIKFKMICVLCEESNVRHHKCDNFSRVLDFWSNVKTVVIMSVHENCHNDPTTRTVGPALMDRISITKLNEMKCTDNVKFINGVNGTGLPFMDDGFAHCGARSLMKANMEACPTPRRCT